MATAAPAAQPAQRPAPVVAPLATITLGMAFLSLTGAPFPKAVTQLEAWGLPAGLAGPVLHVAPVLFAVGGYFVMRALVAGHGPRTRALIYALCGGVIGFFMAFCLDLFVGVIPALEHLTGPMRDTGKLDIAAWCVTGLSIFMAAMMGAIATVGAPAARAMAFEQADAECLEVRDRDRATYAISALGLLGQALFVGALAVAHQVDTNTSLVRIGVAIAVVAGAGAFAWSSWVLWRKFDEMLRRTVIEAYAWSGLLATVGCLAWAVLESFAVVPSMTAYGAIVALVALQTFVSLGISSNMTMAPARPKARAA